MLGCDRGGGEKVFEEVDVVRSLEVKDVIKGEGEVYGGIVKGVEWGLGDGV